MAIPGTTSGTYNSINRYHDAVVWRMSASSPDKPAIVYQAVNLVNGKRYIGITTAGLTKRIRGHRCCASPTTSSRNRPFISAIRKYGAAAFRFDVLHDGLQMSEAREVERVLIAKLKPEYNVTLGGDGVLGHRHSEATRAKLRAWRAVQKVEPRLGKKAPGSGKKGAATRALNGTTTRYWLGKKRDSETVRKIVEAKRGVPRVPPTAAVLEIFKENMRRAARARQRSVRCLDTGHIYPSLTEAGAAIGKGRGAVWHAIKKTQRVGGWRFEYVVP